MCFSTFFIWMKKKICIYFFKCYYFTSCPMLSNKTMFILKNKYSKCNHVGYAIYYKQTGLKITLHYKITI